MYIQPTTNIRLLKGVNLDNSYEHTIYFSSESAQTNYFISKTKHNLTNQTFQRTGKGVARLQLPVGSVYDCNYMMFQNTSFSSKWFYAFVTSVEYINNEVTEITFEIDVMQTWLFNYELGQCYIERQHTTTDAIGGNIVPEPVALGEYVFNSYAELTYANPPNSSYLRTLAVIIAIVDVRGTASDGNVYDGVYGAAELWAFDVTDVTGINDKVTQYISSPDSILSMYMVPAACVLNTIPASGGVKLTRHTGGASLKHTSDRLIITATLDGYRPRNRKLYTYPYNYYHVDNANGQALTLRYEFFDNLQPVMLLKSTITQPVQVVLRPEGYKNVGGYSELGGDTALNTESIELNGYPLCSWNVDTYKAWVAQNSIPIALNAMSSMGQMGIAATYSTNPAGMIAGGVLGTVSNMLSQTYTASIAADVVKGTQNNGGVNCAAGLQTFFGGRASITGDMARRIDDFFDYFGYQINELAVPNLNSRPYWTYVKTATCVVTEDIPGGGVPNDDMKRITEIFNKGITWWNNGDNVGNYSLDNRV